MAGRARTLIRRLGRRLGVGAGEDASRVYVPDVDRRWAELREQYAVAFQTMASATVASWEVAAAELHRALRERGRPDEADGLVERLSDALVPTLSPFQAAERASRDAWKEGTEAARISGRMDDALAPLERQARRLPGAVAEGWEKTVEYLGPALATLGAGDGDHARLLGLGRDLRRVLDAQADAFAADLAGLSVTRLESDLLDAVERYRHGAAQDLEVLLDRARALLVDAA